MSSSNRSRRGKVRLPVAGLAVVAALSLAASACGVSARSATIAAASGPVPAKVKPGSFTGSGGPVFLRGAARSTAQVASQKVALPR